MARKKSPETRADIYTRITNTIVAAIEAGTSNYDMPWHHTGGAVARPSNVASGNAYRGINILSLWASAMGCSFESGLWGTFRQWQACGAQVRKGERGSPIVFYKRLDTEDQVQESVDDRPRLVARGYTVFNLSQVDGYEAASYTPLPESARIAHAETFFHNLNIKTEFGGDGAYYRPSTDTVHMPPFTQFKSAAGFYSVYGHECGHASGSKDRLDRDLTGRFGDEKYSFEEIIVEILAAMMMADLGIACEPRPDHAAYISSWLKILKDQPRAIFAAASEAQKIADWMHAQQPQSTADAA